MDLKIKIHRLKFGFAVDFKFAYEEDKLSSIALLRDSKVGAYNVVTAPKEETSWAVNSVGFP